MRPYATHILVDKELKYHHILSSFLRGSNLAVIRNLPTVIVENRTVSAYFSGRFGHTNDKISAQTKSEGNENIILNGSENKN